MSQPKVKATLAYIRKCYGVIIELMTEEKTRACQINILDNLSEKGNFNVYALRHSDTDWSRPAAVSKGSISVNRFGWFITPDEMDFSKGDEINLTGSNAKYFDFRYDKKSDSARIMDESTYPAADFDINVFFDHNAAIMEAFRYHISKNYEEAGIRIIEPVSYKNDSLVSGLGMLVEFQSAETKPDYCPDFKGIFCMNIKDTTPPVYYPCGHVKMIIAKFKGEYIHDVILYEGHKDDSNNENLKKILEDYEIIMEGQLILQESSNILKSEIRNDPFRYLNLDFEDFVFKTLKRYNAKTPKERIHTKVIPSTKVYSKKTSFEVNTQEDLFKFMENYIDGTL